MARSTLRIDEDRLWRMHEELAQYGATPLGGVNRQALTQAEGEARALFRKWAENVSCTVEADAAGNLFARRDGINPELPAVATGSHLDTQPTGGRFDGAFGVLAGIEVLNALHEADITTKRAIEVVAWSNEEGTRFDHSGSAAFVGLVTLQDLYNATDQAGIRYEDALEAINGKGHKPCGGRHFDSFFEAHIEQGPVLEAAGLSIGIVQGARAQARFTVTVTGEDSHAGTTPMDIRRDALSGAARLMVELERIGQSHRPQGVCTVGALEVHPNSRNVVPGRVKFWIDLRHPTDAGIAAMSAAIEDAMDAEREAGVVKVECQTIDTESATEFDQDLVTLLKSKAVELNIPAMDIFSMAGHDACYLSPLQPTAMIFVPCERGLSHNELENAKPSDLADGTRLLAAAMLERATSP